MHVYVYSVYRANAQSKCAESIIVPVARTCMIRGPVTVTFTYIYK